MRRGITLIEIVAVLGILALMLGILMPALSQVRHAGRGATCLSHLRSMAVSAQHYADHYDTWPVAIRYDSAPVFRSIGWDWQQDAGGTWIPGTMWMDIENPAQVHRCPACPALDEDVPPDQPPSTGYNYNTSFLGGESPWPLTGWEDVRRGTRPSACRRTSTTALLGDGGRYGGTNRFMRSPGNPEAHTLTITYSGGQAFRHVGRTTNVVYLDGHVSPFSRPWQGIHHTDSLLNTALGFPGNGFLSDDDAAYDPR